MQNMKFSTENTDEISDIRRLWMTIVDIEDWDSVVINLGYNSSCL